MYTETELKKIVLFAKNWLRDEGYSKELIAYLLSNYDLPSFINNSSMNKYELAIHLLAHARTIDAAATNY